MDLTQYTLEVFYRADECLLWRGLRVPGGSLEPPSVFVSTCASERPEPERVRMLEHEFALRNELDTTWALRPLALGEYQGHVALMLEDPVRQAPCRLLAAPPLSHTSPHAMAGAGPVDLRLFLRLGVRLAFAVGEMHRRGIVHKDIKPANVLIDEAARRVWLTGFGIASRMSCDHERTGPPETLAGTLAYMAPEQTGRMKRPVDARSDLYALGVTFYEMLTGTLPFTAVEPMEWVHAHIARQPSPLSERAEDIPPALSAIVMKLLSKSPDDRYQTAAGLERDLRRCLAQLEAEGSIADFVPGAYDARDRLTIPDTLYGRTHEREILIAAFERTVKDGTPALVLVSGYSGMGKSCVVNDFRRTLGDRAVFGAGKFDQYKRDIPYATLAQAFGSVVRPLLAKSEDELEHWRRLLHEALGPNARLMTDLIPELTLLIGEQPPVPELPPQDAQGRFHVVFQRFLAVFVGAEQPLVLFIDDLQWLDVATLDLLGGLLSQNQIRHFMLIGAFRDNEVTPAHPLMRTLEAIRGAGAHVEEIALSPLGLEDVGRLIADSLSCDLEGAAPLAQLVHEKTAGNPFFVVQFLLAMVEEHLLAFDHGASRWSWDLTRIHAKGFTDNVADLVIDKLNRLPPATQETLQEFACLGGSAEPALLAMIRGCSTERLQRDLKDAVSNGLVLATPDSYRFLHDRVQEAAYSQIAEERRVRAHLKIGRLLESRLSAETRDGAIFEIVNQLNRAAAHISSPDEKERLAALNLLAGERAKTSTAYVSALRYLVSGVSLLSGEGWSRRPDLMLALQLQKSECEFLTGQLAAAEAGLTDLASRAADPLDQAAVAGLRIDLYTTLDRSDRAVDVCLSYLRHVGIEWNAHPDEEEARREYERTEVLLANRATEALIDLPLMSDAVALATLDVLNKVVSPALFTDANLHTLVICRMVNLSLSLGNSDASCYAYTWLGQIAGARFGNYAAGFRFGQLGYDLVERRGLARFKARTYMCFGALIMPWTRHVTAGRDLIRRAFETANAIGDLTFGAYSCNNLVTILLAAGEPLADVHREAEQGSRFAENARFGLVVDIIASQLALIRTLRGLTNVFGSFDDARFDENEVERRLSADPVLAIAACWYWIRKMQARFLAGDAAAAVDASLHAQRLLWTSPSFFETAEAHFYGALSHAACCDSSGSEASRAHLRQLIAHHRQLLEWAGHCPANFADRAALVGAEIARIEGRELDAERLYEGAVRSARENRFIHGEALANELAARFHAARGFETISRAYLRSARYCYLRWGAEGKVRQLDRLYPHLRTEEGAAIQTRTIGASLQQLDVATVIKISQAISREMVLDKLLDTLMRTAIEHAGAERAVLILTRDAEQRVAAEATTTGDAVVVQLCDEAVGAARLPQTILRYVVHTQESVILDDAAVPNPFSADPYIGSHVRSVLCLPLSNQGKLIGLLFLENNLASHVFAPECLAVLKLLASQGATSLENTRLYRDLAEREARIRRLVDANVIGIVIFEFEGRILDANDAFLATVGYGREDLIAGRLNWNDLTPPEWRDRDERHWMPQLKVNGTLQPFEKEYFRKDGSRVPVLIGAAAFEETGNRGVAYVLDLTERRLAQEALTRASTELAHVSRIAALSALTASIAHEVNQPLAGIITNAGACLRMLDADPPNVDGARRTARRTIRDGNRAADVVTRLRSLFGKRELTLDPLDLNDAAREVVALLSNDFRQNRIAVRTELAEDLPPVAGDRIQLQQVILNLLRNASDAMCEVHDRPRNLLIRTQSEDGASARLTVRDTGVGLSQPDVGSLFDAFSTTKTGGMGIGLFVSRSIIEKHHGRLWAESNPGTPGAAFSISIPCLRTGEPSHATRAPVPAQRRS